jgi:cellulose biosynthesis protein BcsQ
MTDRPAEAQTPDESRGGKIVTFYSFKGGTGRTMALANVAWILAANGRRVLVADWDLESPGLYRYFEPFLDEREILEGPGVINLISAYEQTAMKTEVEDRPATFDALSRVQQYAFTLRWEFENGGHLAFLSPGRQNRDYSAALSGMDWDNFYEALSGGEFLDALKADMRRNYDYALIDSRTGFSDIADICTLHLPDILVDCFTLNTQGIEGAAGVAALIQQRHRDRGIRLLPVPMRVDLAEKKKVDDGRLRAMRRFPGLPAGMTDIERREYWATIEIPYQAFYGYDEMLAVFGDKPDMPGSLLSAYERLTARITQNAVTSLPRMDEQLRLRTGDKFSRSAPFAGELIVIESLPEDQAWAEWIGAVLGDVDIEVRQHRLDQPDSVPVTEPDGDDTPFSRTLVVVSSAYLQRRRRASMSAPGADLAAYVTPPATLTEFSSAAPVFLSGVPESEGIERLRRLLVMGGKPPADGSAAKLRYPGGLPAARPTSDSFARSCGNTVPGPSRRSPCTVLAASARLRSRWSTCTGSGPIMT